MSIKNIALTRGVPPAESFPTEQLVECSSAALHKYGPEILQYGGGAGFGRLRSYLAAQAGVDDDQVIIGQGSLLLQDLISRLLLGTGKLVYVENPTYDRTILTFRRTGADVQGIPLTSDGLDVDFLADQLKRGQKPVFIYIIPDFQNPAGSVMALEKRQQVVALAEKYGFWILEDAPYRKLRYRGETIPSLFELAPERVLQMSSFSKLVSPGLRVGTVIVPKLIADDLLRLAVDTYICPTYLVQAMIYEFIERGWLDENIAHLKRLYQPRLDAMLESLDKYFGKLATWYRPDGGFFVGMTLNQDINQNELLSRSKTAGLVLTDGRGFFTDRVEKCFVRLPFCALPPEDIREGISRLAIVVEELSGECVLNHSIYH
jgi:2-aminoadipate transaminase